MTGSSSRGQQGPFAALARRSVLKLMRGERKAPGLLAIALGREGFATAHVLPGERDAPRVERCDFVPIPLGRGLISELADFVARSGLRGTRCVFTLGPEDYALRVVEAPDVPPEELAGAARWSVRDLVGFEVEQAVVGVFESPSHKRQPDQGRIFVAAVREARVRELGETARSSGLELAAIDIPELALRNLVALHPGDESGLALVALRGEVGLITITRRGYLCGARWIDVYLDALAAVDDKGEPEPELENLLAQIKRSLDYHERELGQPPATAIALAPVDRDLAAASAYLSHHLALPVCSLNLNDLLELSEPLDAAGQFRCLVAVGAGLREHSSAAQEIDLSLSGEEDQQLPLAPLRMLQIAGACAAVLLVATLWLLGSSALERRAIARLEQDSEALQAQVASLELQAAGHLDASGLQAASQSLRHELDSKNRLVRWITDPHLSNSVGFSPQLLGLSRRHVQGLWLRGFEFEAGGQVVSLAGSALHSELVPRFLGRLGEESTFSGKEFDTFFLRRSEQNASVIEFEVSNRPQEDAS